MNIDKPKSWRKGQTIFNFLEFLMSRGYNSNQSYRMADPFHISDEELDELWGEFIKEVK